MNNMPKMIDIEAAECSWAPDYEREIGRIRASVGVRRVNEIVAGVVTGARWSIYAGGVRPSGARKTNMNGL